MMMMVILIFSSIRMEAKNEEPRSYEQKKTKKGGLDDFSPNSFLLSFFLPTTVFGSTYPTSTRHTITKRDDRRRNEPNPLQNARRERERETKRSTTAEGEKGKRWRTTTNRCLREDVNLETTQ